MYGTETAASLALDSPQTLFYVNPDRPQSGPPERRLRGRSWLTLLTGRTIPSASGKAEHPPARRRRRIRETASPLRQTLTSTDTRDPIALPAVTVTLTSPAPAPPLSYREWLDLRVLRSRWFVWIIAFYFHFLCVLVLAILIVHAPERFEQILLNATFSAPDDLMTEILPVVELQPVTTESETTELSAAPELIESLRVAEFSPLSLEAATSELLPNAIRQLALASSPGTPALTKGSSPGPPTPVSAVTSGSFSVWTEPENPDPGEPYRIVIQIRIPENTAEYHVADLDGVVVGSDGYRKPIPGSLKGMLPIESGHVRLVIHIVSADEEVEDTIFIRSKMLKESQKLQLRF